MVVQLPDGALAAAVGVQIYSHICLICSVVMILVVWKHHERDSYVALLSFATFLSTAASIAQQLHTIIRWDEVKTEQFYYVARHLGSPEIAVAGPSYGLDLVLFYIQYYCYNVEGILALFWAFALAISVYYPSEHSRYHRISRTSSIIAKTIAIVLPAVLIGFLRIPAVRNSPALFLALADFSLASSLLLGSILLIAILAKYIYTRRRMQLWMLRYRFSRGSNNGGDSELDILEERQSGIYDSWLILRFTIAFVFIEAFQILTILSEVVKFNGNRKEEQPDGPDLSAAHARGDFAEFVPGVSVGLLVFLVFGTTRPCIQTVYAMLLPRAFRRRVMGSTEIEPPLPSFGAAVYQGSTFLTTPRSLSQQRSPSRRRTSEPNPNPSPSSERESAGRTRSTGQSEEPQTLAYNNMTVSSEIQEHDLETCSINSFDACKLARNDADGGQLPTPGNDNTS